MIQVIDKITYLPSNSTPENELCNKTYKKFVEVVKKKVRGILSGGESAIVTIYGRAQISNGKIEFKITHCENQDLVDRLDKTLKQIRF
jgi:hypothetical protein